MQPYEFGYVVGSQMKQAGVLGDIGSGISNAASEMWNPTTSLGTAANIAGYMTPGVGSVLAARDLYNNVSQGNVLGSLGSAGMMALGLIPGAGLPGGAAKGLARGGRALMGGGRVAQTVGKGLNAAAEGTMAASRGMVAANRSATGINSALSQGIQKHVPLAQTSWKSVGPMSVPLNPLKSTMNAAIRNPINTLAMTTSSAPPENTAAQINAQQLSGAGPLTQPATPAPRVPTLNRPMAPGSFRPQPIARF